LDASFLFDLFAYSKKSSTFVAKSNIYETQTSRTTPCFIRDISNRGSQNAGLAK
jgi:hypothetical protein